MSKCRSCRAPIRWVFTERGKKMPLDAEPTDEGDIVLRDPPPGESDPTGIVVAPAAFPDEPRYTSHFATCKQAGEWRKPR